MLAQFKNIPTHITGDPIYQSLFKFDIKFDIDNEKLLIEKKDIIEQLFSINTDFPSNKLSLIFNLNYDEKSCNISPYNELLNIQNSNIKFDIIIQKELKSGKSYASMKFENCKLLPFKNKIFSGSYDQELRNEIQYLEVEIEFEDSILSQIGK